MFFSVSRIGDSFGGCNFKCKFGRNLEYLGMKLIQTKLVESEIILRYISRKFAMFF